MNWNFSAGQFALRLPVTEQDSEALFNLLKQQALCDHIPRLAMTISVQAYDELRRIAMRFETREAAFWLVENAAGNVVARVGVQRINWMLRAAQMQWEISDSLSVAEVNEFVSALRNFCFDELGLHRLEVRLRKNARQQELLQGLGFSYEGSLPAQLEYDNASIDLDIWSYLATDR